MTVLMSILQICDDFILLNIYRYFCPDSKKYTWCIKADLVLYNQDLICSLGQSNFSFKIEYPKFLLRTLLHHSCVLINFIEVIQLARRKGLLEIDYLISQRYTECPQNISPLPE